MHVYSERESKYIGVLCRQTQLVLCGSLEIIGYAKLSGLQFEKVSQTYVKRSLIVMKFSCCYSTFSLNIDDFLNNERADI